MKVLVAEPQLCGMSRLRGGQPTLPLRAQTTSLSISNFRLPLGQSEASETPIILLLAAAVSGNASR